MIRVPWMKSSDVGWLRHPGRGREAMIRYQIVAAAVAAVLAVTSAASAWQCGAGDA
jgi:hypothetical protein